MISASSQQRWLAFLAPGALVAGLGLSALVGWHASFASGTEAGLAIFALLGAVTLVMSGALAWALRMAARETDRASEALAEARESLLRFEQLVELSTDWYWEQDAQFRFTEMSGGVLNKGGFRINESLGKTRWDLPIHEPDAETWRRHREQLERHEPFHDLRYRIKVTDGSVRTYSISGLPRFDARGRFTGYRGIGRDITAATAAEEALRKSEERFKLVMDATEDGIWDYDPLTDANYFSPGFVGLLGYADREALRRGFSLSEALHPDDRDRVLAGQRSVLDRGGRFDETYRLKTAQGDYRWFRGRGQAITDESGKVCRFTGALTDIDAQKQSELKLRLAATVFESSLEGVAITDAAGDIVSVNQAFSRITGYAAEEVVGRNPRLLQSGRQDAAFYSALWQALTSEGAWSGEIWNKRRNGEIYPEKLSITAVRDERGRPLHYIGVFTDISDLKRAEEAVRAANADLERRVKERTAELEASNRELEAFSYSVSHDLRGPLRGIEGFAQIVGKDYAHCLDETGQGHLARIRLAAQRMAQLIDDLLELARITRTDMHRRQVDLTALALAIARDLQTGANRRASFHIQPGLMAWADPTLVATLLENLLGNAWKFTSRQAEARIECGVIENRPAAAPPQDGAAGGPERSDPSSPPSTGRREGERCFFVRDNGAGFDPTYADKLFQPFQRLHHPDEFAGTGIGLATVARVVRRHGGSVWAEGLPGQGATFFFTLP